MASKIADAFVEIGSRTKKFDQGMSKVRKRLSGLNKGFGNITKKAELFGVALGAAVLFGAKKALDASASMELLEGRMVTLLGSTEKAAAAMKFFGETAAKVPFSIEQVTEAGVTLTAMGASFKKWLPLANDVAAVMGVDLTVAASQLGRAFAGGGAAADIFREKGILEIIKTSSGIKDFSKKTIPEFRKAMFEAFTDPGGKIAGASGRLADTLTGQLSMIGDSFFKLKVKIGETLTPAIKELVTQTQPLLQQWIELLSNNKGLSESLENIAKQFTEFRQTLVLTIFNLQDEWAMANANMQFIWAKTTGEIAKLFLLVSQSVAASINFMKKSWLVAQDLFSQGISGVLIPVSEKWSKAFADSAGNIKREAMGIDASFKSLSAEQDKQTKKITDDIIKRFFDQTKTIEGMRKAFFENENKEKDKNLDKDKKRETDLTDTINKENKKRKISFIKAEDLFKKIQEDAKKDGDVIGKAVGALPGAQAQADIAKAQNGGNRILSKIEEIEKQGNATLREIADTLKSSRTLSTNAPMGI